MPAALTITGNTNDAQAAIARLERQYDNLENKVKRLGQVTKQSADQGAGSFASMAQGAANFAGSLVGVTSALDLVVKGIGIAKSEWDDYMQRQERALNSNRQFAQNLTRFALATDAPLGDAKDLMLRLSRENNVDLKDIPGMLNRFQAAKGPTQGMAEVEKMFVAAARLGKFDPESMGMLGETGLDITKQIPGTTAEQALGFSLAAQAQSRVADPRMFNKNVLPAALGGNKISGTPLEVGVAISNALTHGSGDTTGRRSRTAQIAFEMQAAEAFPEIDGTEARIKYMRDNPEIRKGFLHGLKNRIVGPNGEILELEGYHGEKSMRPAIEAMLTEGSAESRIFDETRRSLVPLAGADAEYKRRALGMAKDPNLQAAERDRAYQNAAERTRIGDTAGAKDAAARLGFDANLEAHGFGDMERYYMRWQKWGRTALLRQTEEEASFNTLDANIRYGTLGELQGHSLREGTADRLRKVRDNFEPTGLQTVFTDPEQERRRAQAFDHSLMAGRGAGTDVEAMEKQNGILTRIEEGLNSRPLKRNGQVEQ